MSQHHPTPLKFLMPGWFSIVMGLSGLALAWSSAAALMGDWAGAAALALGVLALAAFVMLLGASWMRWQRYPKALQEDLKHPVRHAFVATLPVSLLLLATVALAVAGPSLAARLLWMVGSVLQFAVTVWVLQRWLLGPKDGGLQWGGLTPVLFIPIVGNVVAPLAGVSLGFTSWSAAQFGIGLLFWPVVLTLLAVRLAQQGLWPDRLLPTTFISVAPPAVMGSAALQLGAAPVVAWMSWGVGLFFLFWSASLFKRMVAQPFSVTFWALSFPLASLAALTLRLAALPGTGSLFVALAMMGLALASVVIAFLLLGTFKGLRDGSLLAPEPVATIIPVSGTAAL